MTTALTEEQRALQEAARRFARERIAPGYMAREKTGRVDRDLVREMGALGLIGADLPEEHGGLGAPSVTAGLAIEAVAHADINVSYVPLLASLNGQIIARHASAELAGEWIPRIVAGEALFCIGLTEPRGGSDAANLQLSARRDGDDYVLNGEKSSISMADQADAAVIFARTGAPDSGARGVSAFLVPMDAKGVTTTRFNDLGSHAIGRGSIFFDDVRIPAANRLAEEGMGFVQVMQGFDYSRALIGLQCCAAAQASLDESWAYVQERQAFGAPIAQYQGVTFPLAEGEGLVAAIRQLCYHTLRLRDEGAPHTAEAAMCKWLGPKTAVDVIHQCLLTHGHYGWSLDLPHQQRLRDVMGLEIGDGTAQIMKLIVARERAGKAAVQYATRR
ncbi:cyclohexanecarboxyl-CoA dehydrogenase [Neoroseomonas oryzicola]|uniref:Cyclohexanecarboxyl-CoA dehydrogenase n=1 Tax=Neoroseomonas oryzicola TaxID=535904 RepID=A0A9X9WFG0_9PROT|nr:cyclohexanecarboxyl-CoA dehydrogenase [Neoroseomonas oryzicola]NKE17007.1 cyclohexanecarboxyl-CoA dehydrogenase [Neoroseomonas oryzicola]